MNIIIFGPPLAGKGTQSRKIIADFGLDHLSTGDALRAEKKAGSALGIAAAEYSKKGLLAPDELVAKVVEKHYLHHKKGNGVLFDGYPRNLAQAKHLIDLLQREKGHIHLIIFLEVPNAILLERAKKRAAEENRKDDKDPNIVLRRIEEFEKLTIPTFQYLKSIDIPTLTINGDQTVIAIYSEIHDVLNIDNI
jgi:adenylate kinase